MGRARFPRANERFFCHVKEGEAFRGGVLAYAAQGNPQTDLSACGPPAQAGAESAKKRRFWTGTSSSWRRLDVTPHASMPQPKSDPNPPRTDPAELPFDLKNVSTNGSNVVRIRPARPVSTPSFEANVEAAR